MWSCKRRKVGERCWLYDDNMKECRPVKVLEVIEQARHNFSQEYYIVEASCHVDCFPMLASQAELKDSKENK